MSESRQVLDKSAEIVRLNKIVSALMDRAERSTSVQESDFGLFQSTIMLEEQIRSRTAALEDALRENERITRALRESEATFRGLVSQSLIGIVLVEDGKFSYSNAKFNEIFGYSAEEVKEIGPLQVTVEDDRALVEEKVRKRLSGELDRVEYVFRGLRKDGETVNIECHSSRMAVGPRSFLVSLILDITERTRAESKVRALQELLQEESTHDSLTGLYNRRYLDEVFGPEVDRAEKAGRPVSVIIGDLDHFKTVNDHYGHLAGDEVLRDFSALMKQHARAGDICCRYGGEEFLLVLPGVKQDDAVVRAEQLRRAIAAATMTHGESRITVTASFGVACFPQHGRSCDSLVAAADAALYAAKAGGRNRVIAGRARDAQDRA